MITNNFNKELRRISDALRDLGYSDATIGLRQRYWKEYCSFHGSLDIDEVSMDTFLANVYSIHSGNINISKRQYEVRAALRNLLEFRRHGKIIQYHTPWFTGMPWVESYKSVVEDFLAHQKDLGNKPETILNYERTLKRFTNYLYSIGVESFCELTAAHVSSFLTDSINEVVRNLRSMLCHLRVLFRYLYLNGYTSEDLSLVIPKSNVLLKRKHIPTTWTKDDIEKILSCIDVANPVGKRDYAIILLVARLGIRVSDVTRLRFDNIKWEKNCIQFTQYKTNELLILPLFEDVGSAIIDYLQHGRPASDLDRVFITHKPPFQAFSKNNHLYGMFNKYLLRAGIVVTPEKNHGLHTLRHTLANELLRKEVPLPVISEILGHKSLETTMQYLRADTEQLRYCTLVEGENYAT
jgi:site-specific recombinase XerD